MSFVRKSLVRCTRRLGSLESHNTVLELPQSESITAGCRRPACSPWAIAACCRAGGARRGRGARPAPRPAASRRPRARTRAAGPAPACT